MDDTQQSRSSEAAATRKRRSSILKSQRPARTPFSELEFNVATPTDTAKSRRVSFSRRTGVAEFVTNEATTTWKNFYEEHNKSLESSGNDSDAHATRQTVEHLGRRIFDQQFEEVEAVDFVGNLNPSISANASLNNINFSQAIEAVEFTTEGKITAPHKKFELSTLPDPESKLFGNDFTITGVGELTGKIDFNFSNIQRIGERDDLKDIERDLEHAVTNVVCQGPADRHNISEYIEVDLNMTHVAKNDDCDMSITDTVRSPKVQDLSKSSSIDKKINLEKDWLTDKENIAINPYAAPCEAENFAVNDEPNQVLVFDGKRLTLQTDKNRQSIVPNITEERPQRKTIVLNTNDDLPNFKDEVSFKTDPEPRYSTAFHDPPKVCVKAVHKIDIVKRQSVHDNLGNLSITQSLPTNIISGAFDKHETTSNKDEENISITQSINGQIITGNKPVGRRRTVVYEDETGNISITQALPSNILQNTKHEKRKTIVFDEDGGNISITQGISSQLILGQNTEKRKTIVFDDDKANISITQAISSQVIIDQKVQEKRKTIVFDDDNGNISITQALPANIVLESQRQEKRKTIIYEDNTGNISVTQAAPTNLILTGNHGVTERRRTILFEDDTGNISVTQAIPQNIILGKTEHADNTKIFDASNISMTQALPTNIILKDSATNKRRTIVYDDDTGNISITQAIPSQLIPGIVNLDKPDNKDEIDLNPSSNVFSETVNDCRTIVDEKVGSINNIAIQPSPAMEVIDNTPTSSDFQLNPSTSISSEIINKSKTVFYNDESDISMTQAIPSNIILLNQEDKKENELKEETVIFENDLCEDSISEDLPANAFLLRGISSSADEIVLDVSDNKETLDEQISKQVFNDPVSVASLRQREAGCADENCETEITITEPMSQILIQEIRKTQSLDRRNLSITKPIPDQLFSIQSLILSKPIEKVSDLCEQTNICKENQNVVIYQTVTSDNSPTLSKIEHGDINSGVTTDCDSNITISSKVVETDVTESPSSKEPSDRTSLLSKDAVGHVIEPKLEIYDIKMDILEAENKSTHSITNNSFKVESSKTSVLHNLLDMTEPIYNDFLEKSAEMNTDPLPLEPEPIPSEESSMVYLVIDQDAEMQTDKIEIDNDAELTESESDNFHIVRQSPLSIEYKEQDDHLENTLTELLENRDKCDEEKPDLDDHLQNTLTELMDRRDKIVDDNKSITDEKGERINRRKSIKQANDIKALNYIEEEKSDTFSTGERDEEISYHKSFKDANDTKELLDMICDFTDSSRCESKETTNSMQLENKGEVHEQKRLSFATKRQSIVISREDLLNNISMAQAILQKSRVEFNDTGLTEDNQDSSPEDATNVSKRSARMSNEVVKTLHFDDESVSENSLKSDLSTTSPLKKTTFAETSFKKCTNKTHVIPSYLKDVSDGIKQLMADLVKPMTDAIPFESYDERQPRKSMSTVSTQIQANLITSSQIDVEADLSSGPASRENIDDDENVDDIRSYETRNSIVISDIARSSADASGKSSESDVVPTKLVQSPCSPVNNIPKVLVFDHENPLNNILLGPLDFTNVHDYKPRHNVPIQNLSKKSDETLCGSDRSESCQINMEIDNTSTDTDIELVARDVEVNTEAIVAQYCTTVHGFVDNRQIHKPTSNDRAVHVQSTVENIEVNTIIAMKPNSELLNSSSCLTLIEDTLPDSESASSQYFVAKKKESKLPTKATPILDTDMTSTDDDTDRIKSKGKKRIHLPGTPNQRASINVTPKPNSKMQKISNSPNRNRILLRMSHEPTKLTAERDTEDIENQPAVKSFEDKTKTEKKSPNCGFNSSITIQQLITDYKIDAGINKEILDILKDNDFCKSNSLTTEAAPESVTSDSLSKVCSFTSSKNHGSIKRPQSNSTSASSPKSQSTFQSGECTRVEWHPELCSMAANKNVSYIDSGVNIVSKIDMLPFMGSYECERESSLADTWSFRLLHGRIRLTVRLAHRHDNATRTRVRADTPVTDISVDTIDYDKKNPVAILCIRFACETMRYMVSSASETSYLARDVPLILRRCAAVARVALRWGRSMHDAKLHLAYTLNTEGFLTLKVANIPLRSVWEVSMELELVVEHPSQAPWPRAGNVRVNRVVSDVPVSDDDVRKVMKHIPNDWGHVPKTLWRIFRYLKNKQRDDDELLMGV